MGHDGRVTERVDTPLIPLLAVMLWGALAAVLTAPFTAALTALAFRFPIPFDGYAEGGGEALNAAFASVFYLVSGGGFVLAACGAGAGYLLARRTTAGLWPLLPLTLLSAGGCALIGTLLLALF